MEPAIAAAMTRAGFALKVKGGGGVEPGTWQTAVLVTGEPRLVPVDLIVPETLATNHGRRDARLPAHGPHATRWAAGLEAATVDNELTTVVSLEPDHDPRSAQIRVAGLAALLIAKCHKLAERLAGAGARTHRIRSKDAADVVRIMRARTPAAEVGVRLAGLAGDRTVGPSVHIGVGYLRDLFGRARGAGTDLAVQALASALDEDEIRLLAPAYVAEVLDSYTGPVGRRSAGTEDVA